MQSLHEDEFAPQQTHWIPLADLMTGLMMVFLLVAVTYMVKVEAAARQVKEIAVLYEQKRTDLYRDLKKEFERDLPRWKAEIYPDMTVRFEEPDVLFRTGSTELAPRFKNILDDFFPRYIKILESRKYKDGIREIRIEGYTSSIWETARSEQEAYFQNMRLSQDRTRSALEYVLGLPAITNDLAWLRSHITANGLSSSKRILKPDGSEDYAQSQRVEFRVRTDAESRIARIIELEK